MGEGGLSPESQDWLRVKRVKAGEKGHNKELTYVPLACSLRCQAVFLPAGLGEEWAVAGMLATHLKCGVNAKTEGLVSFSSLS